MKASDLTTYLCELSFSKLTEIKTSKREQLGTTDEEMRVVLSRVSPHTSLFCLIRQAKMSH
jgi:hypothetical protein